MADNPVQFELVSPEKLLLSDDVEMVVVPGVEGDFGVLPGHAPMISTVRPGVIHVFESGSVKSRIFVAGGFAEVTAERCTVLAEEAVPLDEIDRAGVEKDLQDANEDIRDAGGDAAQLGLAEARAATARAKLASLDNLVYQ
ncbi:MAG: F0F1 ATP synthase subunit epsilon [Rhodospirillaceae bacterium]|nr:F0F1 ATP synthase subunit epsilon [Rhodospirillaceae bacterium]MBT5943306.1 F0F1 ATP synthase subunit epsilon [Rhodospirillaceae bacterium]MBT6404818.1 F0F1 ATP synthase subunit epsilon [Rhodospirillaceae bacterium]MBT6536773.1 F0F1 ATP synthase subunit epsilon [Rhodospirillaceae bacterium]MBT7360517.1 F0F1 ATP synthase subunit epsilon [Rhodospirillaceae bacterium]